MSRYGPLQSHRQTLTVGDPTRQHLAFTRGEIRYQGADELRESYDWDGITGVQFDLPMTRFRFPGAVSGLILSSIALFVQDDPHISPKDGTFTITTRDGHVTYPLSSHHLGGYWRRSVYVAQQLVNRLVHEPSARALLDHPDTLIKSASSVGSRRQ